MTVQVELNDDGTVKTLAIDTPNETAGLGQRASEAEFTDQFIGKAGPFVYGENGIDALSGATITSNAVLEAINGLVGGAAAEEKPTEETKTEVPAAEETKTEEPAADGALSATVQGFGGDVTVQVELNDDGTVKTLAIDTPNETAGLGQRASEAEFTDQFIGKAGPFTYGENGIDALSGATITSNAVLEAINGLVGGASAAPAEETPAADGALSATVQGFGGDVTVQVELNDDGTVKSLAIDTPNETAGLGQRASEAEFTDQFIGKAGPFAYGENGVDALSGATITSNAVLEAINGLVGGAASAPAEETPAEETKTEEPAAAETKTEEPAAEEKPAEEKPAETAAKTESSASAGQVYGSYMSEKETDFSKIRVLISTKNDVITECKITSEAKSEGSDFLKDEIKTEWAKAIVEAQGAENDTITGATLKFSAGAVTEAVAEIKAQMAGEAATPAKIPAAEETKTEQPAEEKPAEEKPAEEAKIEETKAPSAYGGYLAEKETAFSTIRVIISTHSGEIVGCKVICDAKEGQTDLVTDENEANWAKAIVETQGAEIDTVTGATISSDAVKEAVAEILAKIR